MTTINCMIAAEISDQRQTMSAIFTNIETEYKKRKHNIDSETGQMDLDRVAGDIVLKHNLTVKESDFMQRINFHVGRTPDAKPVLILHPSYMSHGFVVGDLKQRKAILPN